MKSGKGRGKAGGNSSASKKSKGTSIHSSSSQPASQRNSEKRKNKPKDGMLLMNLIIGMLVVMTGLVIVSVVSSSDQLGALTVYPQGPEMARPRAHGFSVSNAAEFTAQQQTGNGAMFAQARSMEDSLSIGSKILENDSDTEVVSMDPNMKHVHFIQSATNVPKPIPTNSYTKSTLHEYENSGDEISSSNKKNRDSSYAYYYYDSFTQSFHLHQEYTTFPDKPASFDLQPFQRSFPVPSRYQPSLCKDGYSYGYSNWFTLRSAIHELSNVYKYAVDRWDHYNAAMSEYERIKFTHHSKTEEKQQKQDELTIQPPPQLPQHLIDFLDIPPDPFVICPYATLRSKRNFPIQVDAEDIVIECDSCVIDVSGTHFSFGAHAKNVILRGLTMTGATSSSLVFHYNGADANFEDCYWVNNEGTGVHGAVADMNSTSTVNFLRCEISDMKNPLPRSVGTSGLPTGFVSSLTMRSRN